MNIYIPLSLFLIILCYTTRNNRKQCRTCFFISMTVLFIFAALRYNFGADYTSYLADFKESKVHGADSHYEIEFIFGRYLVLFPKYIYFIAFTSLLWFSSLYYLFKTNVPYKYYVSMFYRRMHNPWPSGYKKCSSYGGFCMVNVLCNNGSEIDCFRFAYI